MLRSARPHVTLSESTQRRLNTYALAAGAAGIGMFAATPSAAARIVYTPTHKLVTLNHKVVLDLNHDGKNDFMLQETFITTTSVGESHSIILSVLPARKANEIWGMNHQASALPAGVRVGPKGRFSYAARRSMAVDHYADGTGGSGTCAGPWNNVKKHYLGLRFTINGKTHFGWARLNVTCTTTFSQHVVTGLLTGYAYETVPNKPIVTGKIKGSSAVATNAGLPRSVPVSSLGLRPATLDLLAIGSPGLSAWRRKQ